MFGRAPRAASEPVCVFILAYNRPLYLWACLDSLYRLTRHPAKFILADNASSDPLVKDVIRGFDRRRMFHAVHYCPDNRSDRLKWMLEQHRGELGEFFAFVECDVVVEDTEEGWLGTMTRIMHAHPDLWMLGSAIDQRDFVSLETARAIEPSRPREECEFLVKANSVERQPLQRRGGLLEPHNPPMRLSLLRTELLRHIVVRSDYEIYFDIKKLGKHAKITPEVRHRHLSLLNLFDYPEYGFENREAWVKELRAGTKLTEI